MTFMQALLLSLLLIGPGAVAIAEEDPNYDLQDAMAFAGKQVPRDRDEYYFFEVETDGSEDLMARELESLLEKASAEQEFLAVVGPDPDLNRTVLSLAVELHGNGRLPGLVLIYLGPRSHRPEIESLIQALGATCRFLEYPARQLPGGSQSREDI